MAELLLTQSELDSYLSKIDLEDPANNRVFNAIQLLTTNNYNDLLYFLVVGKITLQQLYETPINNATARSLIAAAERGGDTILSNKRHYEAFLKSLPSFQSFANDIGAGMGQYMYLMAYPSVSFVRTVSIDATGLDPLKFAGIAPIKEKYSKILADCHASPEWLAVTSYASANGLTKIVDLFSKELKFFEMISTSDRKLIPLKAGAKDSVCGYVVRELFVYSYRVYYTDYMDFVLTKMAENRSHDTLGNGVAGLRAAQASTPWSLVESPLDAQSFVRNLGMAYFVHYAMPMVYGTTYFTQTELTTAKQRLDRIIGGTTATGLLPLLRQFLVRLDAELASRLVP